jgi:hypothetical protein
MILYSLSYWQCTAWVNDTVQSELLTLYTLNHWQCTVWVTGAKQSESMALHILSQWYCTVCHRRWTVGVTDNERSESLICIVWVTDPVQSKSIELKSPSHWQCIVWVTNIIVLKSPALCIWSQWTSYHTLRIYVMCVCVYVSKGTESCNHRATVTQHPQYSHSYPTTPTGQPRLPNVHSTATVTQQHPQYSHSYPTTSTVQSVTQQHPQYSHGYQTTPTVQPVTQQHPQYSHSYPTTSTVQPQLPNNIHIPFTGFHLNILCVSKIQQADGHRAQGRQWSSIARHNMQL